MFQFPGYAPLARYHAFSMVGCPIRTPADHVLFADPRSFSQLITSFVASESLGILHTLFSYFFFQVIRLLLLMTRLCARFTREVSFSRIAPENIDPFYYSSIFNMSMNSLLGLLAQTPFRNGSSLLKDLNIRQRCQSIVHGQLSMVSCQHILSIFLSHPTWTTSTITYCHFTPPLLQERARVRPWRISDSNR